MRQTRGAPREAVARAPKRGLLALAGVVALPLLAGLGLGALVGWAAFGRAFLGASLGFVGVAVVMTLGWALLAPARLLGAAAPEGRDRALLESVLRSLAVRAGVKEPRLGVLPWEAPGALPLEEAGRPLLLVTRGSLSLGSLELEALLAHALAHVRRGEGRILSAVLLTGGLPLALLARLGRSPAPLVRLLALCTGPGSEVAADLEGSRLSRYPPAFLSLLDQAQGSRGLPCTSLSTQERKEVLEWA